MGNLINKLAGKLGFVPVDEAVVEEASAAALVRSEMAKLIPGPGSTPQPELKLKLTDRQELAFLNPWQPGADLPIILTQATQLVDGKVISSHLLICCSREGHMIWHGSANLCEIRGGELRVAKPKGLHKGLVITRAQGLVKGVGDIGGNGEWKAGGTHFVVERRMTVSEEAEFTRLYGVKWKADCHALMLKEIAAATEPDDDPTAA